MEVKIILQQIADEQMYAGGGLWVAEVPEALRFETTDEVINFAIKERLLGVQILIHLDSAHLDFVVPCCIIVSSLKPCEV
ncbi:MAG: hypothetical protein JWM68_2781 [Verrucomicrobiales bacterium]|nr:hypothetical protein [Verrucomicrobiales bacterium]